MSAGVALTVDPLRSVSKVTCPCRVPELISRSPGCVSWQRLHSIQYRFSRKLPLDAAVLIDNAGSLRGRTEANLIETFIKKKDECAHLMLNTAACVYETKAFYVLMLLELTDKWKTTKEKTPSKGNRQVNFCS